MSRIVTAPTYCPTCGGSGIVPRWLSRVPYVRQGASPMETAPCPRCIGAPVEADRLARDPILREQAAARAGGWTAPTLFSLEAATGEKR